MNSCTFRRHARLGGQRFSPFAIFLMARQSLGPYSVVVKTSPRAHVYLAISGATIAMASILTGCAAATPGPATSADASGQPSSQASISAGTNTTTDSCSVVTQAEVATAFGAPVQAGVLGKATVEGGVACVFYGAGVPVGTNPDVGIVNSVRVVLVTGTDASKWFNDYQSKVHPVAISGLGDHAFWDGVASVSVLEGNEYLRVAVVPPSGPNETAEKALTTAALARM